MNCVYEEALGPFKEIILLSKFLVTEVKAGIVPEIFTLAVEEV